LTVINFYATIFRALLAPVSPRKPAKAWPHSSVLFLLVSRQPSPVFQYPPALSHAQSAQRVQSLAFFCAFLQSAKTYLSSFQAFPRSFCKIPGGWGYTAKRVSLRRKRGICFFSRHSPLPLAHTRKAAAPAASSACGQFAIYLRCGACVLLWQEATNLGVGGTADRHARRGARVGAGGVLL
jgi:hypothetical protein